VNRPLLRQAAAPRPPRRFWPPAGEQLSIHDIRGPWRPSGSVAASCVFAVVWSCGHRELWAPLHDFAPIDQLRLIEACRRADGGCAEHRRPSGRRP